MSESVRELYSGEKEKSEKEVSYQEVLEKTQKYMAANFSELFSDSSDDKEYEDLQKSFILKWLLENKIEISECKNVEELTDKIYNDMARFGAINDLIYIPNTKQPHEGLEEVNVNSWEDIEVIYNGGTPKKTHVKFNSPKDAKNIFDRILSLNGQKIDTMNPTLVTYLPGGIRVCVNQEPVVSKADGIAASIRIVRPNILSVEKIIAENVASAEMMDLIHLLHSFGVSIAISGGTSTGKTTFLSALLKAVNEGKRIIIVEEKTREINIIWRDENGDIVNNVVSLITRNHVKPEYNISASLLIERALTMNPDYIIIAEMKGEESVIAAEAAITGQVCITTIHANEAYLAYERMVDLALKKYQIAKENLMVKMVQSFPIIIQLEHSFVDQKRRVVEIVEATGVKNGQPVIQTLYSYDYETKTHIRQNNISENLQKLLMKKGATKEQLAPFLKGG